jgi:hypothetical protein
VQPPFGGIGEAALLGDSNEIAKVAQLHGDAIPIKYIKNIKSLGLQGKTTSC